MTTNIIVRFASLSLYMCTHYNFYVIKFVRTLSVFFSMYSDFLFQENDLQIITELLLKVALITTIQYDLSSCLIYHWKTVIAKMLYTYDSVYKFYTSRNKWVNQQ